MEKQRPVADLSQNEIKSIMVLEDMINRDRTGDEVILVAYRDGDKAVGLNKQPSVANPT